MSPLSPALRHAPGSTHEPRRATSRVRAAAFGALALVIAVSQGAYGATALLHAPSERVDRVVTLMTGERVALSTSRGGEHTVRIIGAGGTSSRSQAKTFVLGGDAYVIPAAAQNYLGRYLDPALFDVTKLATVQGDRIPVRVSYSSGASPSLPGVIITSASGGKATGYLTPSSAPTFGAALTDQAVSDSQAGWPSTDTLFGSITKVSLDIPTVPVATPRFPMYTVVIDGISRSGGPLPFAFGFLVNSDDSRKYAAEVFMVHGEARASVPVGTYSALFDELSFSTDGSVTIREMVVTDFKVTGGQKPVVVDARTATATPSVTTPRTSVPVELDTTLAFTDARRYDTVSWGWTIDPAHGRIFFPPTAPPAVGTLAMDTHWISVDPSTPGGRYSFDATFTDPGIPADQARHVPGISQAAADDNTYTADQLTKTAGVARFVFIPGEFFAFATYEPVPIPLRRVDYVYAPPGSSVQDITLADYNAYWDPGFVDGPERRFVAGSSLTQEWFRSPYTLAVPAFPPHYRYAECLACATASRMLVAFGLNDGDPLHSVEIFGSPSGKPIAHFTVYRNGVELFSRPDRLGAAFKIPSNAATYRVVEDLSRRFTGQSLSTSVVTDVTFRSAQGVPAPPTLYCYLGSACSVMPVLTAQLDLHATTHGTVPVGTSMFDIAVGHVMGAAPLPIVSVNVEVRRSGTAAWTALPVTDAGAGMFQAKFSARSWLNGRAMDTRVVVTDSKGGVLRQTTSHAFAVGP